MKLSEAVDKLERIERRVMTAIDLAEASLRDAKVVVKEAEQAKIHAKLSLEAVHEMMRQVRREWPILPSHKE